MSVGPRCFVPQYNPWKPQPQMDALVSALWRVLCPDSIRTRGYELVHTFAQLSNPRNTGTQTLYTNMFDQVITPLPEDTDCWNRHYSSLGLSCCNFWVDVEKQKEKVRSCRRRAPYQSRGLKISRLMQHQTRAAPTNIH